MGSTRPCLPTGRPAQVFPGLLMICDSRILISGKTHTMYGSRGEEGVIDMAVNQLFYAMEETPDRKFLVTVSL